MLIYFSYDGDYEGNRYYKMPFPLIMNFSFSDDILNVIGEYGRMRNNGIPKDVILREFNTYSLKVDFDMTVCHVWAKKSFRKDFCLNEFQNMSLEDYDTFFDCLGEYLLIHNKVKQRGLIGLLDFLFEKTDIGHFFADKLNFRWARKFVGSNSKKVFGSLEYKGD